MPRPNRLPPIPNDARTPEQAAYAADFRARRGVDPVGPYVALMRSPAVCAKVEALGVHMRRASVFPEDLKELAICATARFHTQQFEWSVHVREAEAAGVPRAILNQIAAGRRPDGMNADQALIHDATMELLHTRRWSDETYAQMLARHGEQGVVELPALVGIYALLALVLNVARYPADGPEGLERFPE